MPRLLWMGGSPSASLKDAPAGPTTGNGVWLVAAAGESRLSVREVEDLRDELTAFLQANGR